ncbi:hypothetical protein SMACR_09804 [Sordaria macrospora]|uniref:WGS project CABT00000000 data, contig 2.206 n=2 Tax=Sordaria macrospora TaxID=5147 RepID=F7WCR4_SORMK|nr:uncharacterized protein SMAC_09804 [Sordaria macrospora k-hell]KAA8633990.1 hypothetical protein SMACR_09804 [Sordaria macrospora]WPJ66174.1 hypothetical protein SMAC4_09804 [Sordaria macrospora]CCC05686.1 unnamed protein product [Sordaria macrospora k-hell]
MSSPTGEGNSPTPGPASSTPQTEGLLPGAHWGHRQLPDNNTDSTLGSDVESSTASISSSILKYRTIEGRTYHSDSVTDGEYWAPNDDKANEMLDIFHHLANLLFDGELYTAPITDEPKNAIDIGTGTGLWAIDFADKFPECNVISTDISPIQPSWLSGAAKDWPEIYRQAYRYCKPGGWIEHIDTSTVCYSDDGSVNEKHAMAQWSKVWQEAARLTGYPVDLIEKNRMEEGMKAAGFTNIVSKDYPIPLSPWPKDPKQKERGLFFHALWAPDLEGYVQHTFGNVMGWTKEEMKIYIQHLRAELRNPDLHGQIIFRSVYAQKPLDA